MSSKSEIAVIGMGAMGSAIAARLIQNGASVITYGDGRSAVTRDRISAIGIESVPLNRIASASVVLSIVPPDQAISVAQSLLPFLGREKTVPTFVDLNAISPATVKQLEKVLQHAGCELVDGCIIGGPPVADRAGPHIYVSGRNTDAIDALGSLGLSIVNIAGDVGDASALKMLYAGINKGITGLAAIMLLTASRTGSSDALVEEMRFSMPNLLERFQRSMPDMFPKAGRWVPEMHEIADFLGEENAGHGIFKGLAEVFEQFAERNQSAQNNRRSLQQLLEKD